MNSHKNNCIHCGQRLEEIGGLLLCASCNDRAVSPGDSLQNDIIEFAEKNDKAMIECPGATIYENKTNEVKTGVKFNNPDNPSGGFEIIGMPVYGPKHVRHRWINKEDAHLIRRCQSCQDYTIRMRRKEGPNLYIPPVKNRPLTGPNARKHH